MTIVLTIGLIAVLIALQPQTSCRSLFDRVHMSIRLICRQMSQLVAVTMAVAVTVSMTFRYCGGCCDKQCEYSKECMHDQLSGQVFPRRKLDWPVGRECDCVPGGLRETRGGFHISKVCPCVHAHRGSQCLCIEQATIDGQCIQLGNIGCATVAV